MSSEWQCVDTIAGYERTYRKGSVCVAYRPVEPEAAFLDRDIFVDGTDDPIPLSAVYVPIAAALNDAFYERNLVSVDRYLSQRH